MDDQLIESADIHLIHSFSLDLELQTVTNALQAIPKALRSTGLSAYTQDFQGLFYCGTAIRTRI